MYTAASPVRGSTSDVPTALSRTALTNSTAETTSMRYLVITNILAPTVELTPQSLGPVSSMSTARLTATRRLFSDFLLQHLLQHLPHPIQAPAISESPEAVLTRPREHPSTALAPIQSALVLRPQPARPESYSIHQSHCEAPRNKHHICDVSQQTAHVAVARHLAHSRSPAAQIKQCKVHHSVKMKTLSA
eukprot:6212761-Pleurochrysis_carterae.AAC.4